MVHLYFNLVQQIRIIWCYGSAFAPCQGAHTEQGTSKYFNFRYYLPTGTHTHGLQAAFNGASLNDANGNGALQIKIFKIGSETTI